MIIIFGGENTAESRRLFSEEKQKYSQTDYELTELNGEAIKELDKWLYESSSLFSKKRVFSAENILSKKENRKLLEKFDDKSREVDILIWEESVEDRVLKFFFKNASLKIAKLPYNIFKFLDSIYPTNKSAALEILAQISGSVEENIILYMLAKRVRELIIVKSGTDLGKLADWQIAKLHLQADKWEETKLLSFYDAVFRIEVLAKTGRSYYSIGKALNILLIYSL